MILMAGGLSYCGILWLSIVFGLTHWIPNFYSNSGGIGQHLLRTRELRKVDNVDVLFMGSSHAYRGFDPREFSRNGITAFNLGSTSQTPFNSYYLLKRHLPTTNPEVVVLELYWDMLVKDGLESTIDIVSNTDLEGEIVEMVAASKNPLALNSVLTSGLQRLHTPLDYVEQNGSEHDVYVEGGFTETLIKENTLSEEHLDKLNSVVVEPSPLQLTYLEGIAHLCRDRGVKLVFVVAPVTSEFKNKVVNYREYAATIDKIAAKYQIPLFDYNRRENLQLNTRYDFYDQDHLTQRGVQKFNKLLISDLLNNKVISPECAEIK